jgi:dihydrofolate reductase
LGSFEVVAVIVAIGRNGELGQSNMLPWKMRDDMRFFTETTRGNSVIMGRKTYESIGKPLNDRQTIVLTRQGDFQAEGVEVAHTAEEALALALHPVFIAGGAEIYTLFLPFATTILLTYVDATPKSDAFFPQWNMEGWHAESVKRIERGNGNDHAAHIVKYARITGQTFFVTSRK